MIHLPWGAWYENKIFNLDIPNHWKVNYCRIEDKTALNDKEIREAFEKPVESKRIKDLASNKTKIVILIDDLSRPTQTYRIMPFILEELKRAGIEENFITILTSLGAHRPLTRQDLVKKLGLDIVNKIKIINHNPYFNNVYIGESFRGSPIYINKFIHEADFKIGIGAIIPHANAGFSGGGKIILPGCAGIETISSNHKGAIKGLIGGINNLEQNEIRKEIEEVSSKTNIDFLINIVPNSKCNIAGIFAGNSEEVFKKGVLLARKIFRTKVRKKSDIAIFNAYPKDTEFIQVTNSLNYCYSNSDKNFIKEDGIIVITTAGSEGQGIHYLVGEGMPMHTIFDRDNALIKELLKTKKIYIFSPNLNKNEISAFFSKAIFFSSNWQEIVEKTDKNINNKFPEINIFPTGPLHLSL